MSYVVRIRRKGGVIVVGCDVYIGRQCNMGGWRLSKSKWANPFSAKKYGLDECLRLYKEHIFGNKELFNSLPELNGGKSLGCWCKPNACHGDVLLELLNEYF